MRVKFGALVAVVALLGLLAVPAGAQGPPPANPSTVPWWCTADDPLPMTDMTMQMMMDEATFYPQPKGTLSHRDCAHLTQDLRAARAYAMQYPTAADAVAAGFTMLVPYVHGMGAHYLGPQGISTSFDPRRPNFLMYGGNGPNAPLVGVMWLVDSGSAPPPVGLPGGNDHWHRHMLLCMVHGIIVAEDLTNAACAAMGGVNLDTSHLWMNHGWIIPGWEYRPDVFRMHHPDLGMTPPA
jgi:hypothetical protein